MNKEELFLKIINETVSNNSYLGDDCAYLEELNLLVSQDTLIEGVHFLNSYFTPYEIGKKAIIVNISDILSMGGIPQYITISLSGKLSEEYVKNFYLGVDEVCRQYDIKVIGGDLTGGDKIMISVCILGNAKGRNIASRKNAKVGDYVYLKGYHGSSAKGLEMLLDGNRDKENEFVKAHIEPCLYPLISKQISENVKNYAMMDTSDGLFDSLNRISKLSNVGFEIEYEKVPKKVDDKNLVLFGGEDFGLLACINPKYEKYTDGMTKIGVVTESNKIIVDGFEIVDDKTFNHFK